MVIAIVLSTFLNLSLYLSPRALALSPALLSTALCERGRSLGLSLAFDDAAVCLTLSLGRLDILDGDFDRGNVAAFSFSSAVVSGLCGRV